jgi:hypothetical protein
LSSPVKLAIKKINVNRKVVTVLADPHLSNGVHLPFEIRIRERKEIAAKIVRRLVFLNIKQKIENIINPNE